MSNQSREFEMVAYYPIAYASTLNYSTPLAGKPIAVELAAHRVVLRLPKLGESAGPREFRVFARIGESPDLVAFGTKAIEARVRFIGEVVVHEAPPSLTPLPQFGEQLDAAELAVRRAIARFRSWARLGQPWIGPSDELLRWIEPLYVIDMSTGQTLDSRPRGPAPQATIVGGPFLTEDVVALVETRGEAPSTADEFLADARFLSHWSLAPAYSHAVIAAAVACELKIKSALHKAAEGKETADLLHILLSNPRSFPQAAHELFDSVSKAVIGFSLREHNHALFKDLRKLFETRNAIAHRGIIVEEKESGDLVRTAIAVVEWIDAISPAPTRTS